MAGQTINISVLTDTAPAARGLASLGEQAGGLAGRIGRGVAVGVGVLAVGALAIVGSAGAAVAEVERISAQTSAVLTSTGGAAGRTLEQVTQLADGIERMTGVEAEAIQTGQNLLLTFTNIQGVRFDEATEAAVDLSVAMGTDMTSAATLVGKALNDPIRGLASLSRVGVQFTDDQRAMIEQMVAVGDVAGAQGVILAELERQFGGSAEAFGATFLGGIEKIKNAFGEIIEGPVAAFGPIATAVVQEVAGVLQGFADSPTFDLIVAGAQSISDRFLAWTAEDGIIATVGGFLSDFTLLGQAIQWAGDNQGAANGAWQTFSDAIGDVRDTVVASGLLDALSTLGTEVGGALYDAVRDLAPQLPDLVEGVADLLVAVIPLVPEIVDLAAELVPLLDVILDLVVDDVVPLLIDLLADLLPAVENVVPVVGDLASVFGDVLATAGPAVDVLQSVFDLFGDDAPSQGEYQSAVDAIRDLGDATSWFYEFFGLDVGSMFDAAEDAAGGFADFIYGDLIPAIQAPVEAVQSAWSTMQSRIDGAVSNISRTVSTTFDRLRSLIPAPIRDGIDGAVAVFTGLPGRIAGALASVPRVLFNIGSSMIQGLINGVSGGGSGLVSTLVNLVTGATAQTKSALGINSPSRVFRAIGLGIPEGLSLGVLDGRPLIETAMRGLSDATTSSFTAPEVALAPSSAIVAPESGAQRVYHLTVHAVAPGHEVGRAIVEAIEDYERVGGRA